MLSHITTESPIRLYKYLPGFSIFPSARIPRILFHTHNVFFLFLHSHRHLSLFQFILIYIKLYFLPSNLHLNSYHTSFVNAFDSFIFVIILKTLKLTSSALFGTFILLDESPRILQLPLHLSKITTNG